MCPQQCQCDSVHSCPNHSGLNSHLFVCHIFAQVCGWERLSCSSVEKNPYQTVTAAVNHCTDLKAFENLVLCSARSSDVNTMNVCAFSCVMQELRMTVLGHIKDPSRPVSCLSQLPRTDAWRRVQCILRKCLSQPPVICGS